MNLDVNEASFLSLSLFVFSKFFLQDKNKCLIAEHNLSFLPPS